jgi:hypothetical protein
MPVPKAPDQSQLGSPAVSRTPSPPAEVVVAQSIVDCHRLLRGQLGVNALVLHCGLGAVALTSSDRH